MKKIASVLTKAGQDQIIATAPDFWETLTEFVNELCKINKKQVKKSDFDILTVGDYVARYPNSEFSKEVKEQWQLKEREQNDR